MGVRDNLVLLYGITRLWKKREFVSMLIKNLNKKDLLHIDIDLDEIEDCEEDDETIDSKEFDKTLLPYEKPSKIRKIDPTSQEYQNRLDDVDFDVESMDQEFIMEKLGINSKLFEFFVRYVGNEPDVHLVLKRIKVHEWWKITFDVRNGNVASNGFCEESDTVFKNSVLIASPEEDELLKQYSERLHGETSLVSFMCLHYQS